MLFQNILVPVDLSNQSTRSFKVALDIAKKYDSKMMVLTCIE
ncbi:MAG TPA: universal stress protein, partial [Nitrosopumilus sp.]|nr:universal stress protein [Nitrosopumilus sp.]